MRPQQVNPSNFQVGYIVYDNEDFSVAYGRWESGKKHLAMRWNGVEGTAGYPKVFGHPMWFLVEEELKMPILRSLIGLPDADNEAIFKAIQDISSAGTNTSTSVE